MPQQKPRAFISYSRQDLAVVEELEKHLTAKGIAIWRDLRSLAPGENWPKKAAEAVAALRKKKLRFLQTSRHA